jgi:hypothetical protein
MWPLLQGFPVHSVILSMQKAKRRRKAEQARVPLTEAGNIKIRPHRFGGEGVLIGGQNSNTNCSMTFVNIAVAISALAGGGP